MCTAMGTLKHQVPAESCSRSLSVSRVAPTPPTPTLPVLNSSRCCVTGRRGGQGERGAGREGKREEGEEVGRNTDFKESVHTVYNWKTRHLQSWRPREELASYGFEGSLERDSIIFIMASSPLDEAHSHHRG